LNIYLNKIIYALINLKKDGKFVLYIGSLIGKPFYDIYLILKDSFNEVNIYVPKNIDLTFITAFFKDDTTNQILDSQKFDYALDCIDTLAPKVFFIKACLERKIPIVSSMGAGNKIDPTLIRVDDISKSFNCHLAKYTRKYLYKFGIRKGVKVVFSPEQPAPYMGIKVFQGTNKKSSPGTISYMPAVFGCTVASVAIRDLYLQK
jgi:tRNA A37 threonylcarbamoyladenosine dehydratase